MKKIVEWKTCTLCGKSKPLDPEHWRRNKKYGDGFDKYCKPCAQQEIKAHYHPFSKDDIAKRGVVGIWCLLWSPKCGVCPCASKSDLSECWRLARIHPASEYYPEELNHEAP
jgi:hypothetical protein